LVGQWLILAITFITPLVIGCWLAGYAIAAISHFVASTGWLATLRCHCLHYVAVSHCYWLPPAVTLLAMAAGHW